MEPAVTLPSGPSILVLPLDVLTNDQEQSYFADGLTEQLAVALTAYPDFLIIGPLSRDRLRSAGAIAVEALGQRYGARFMLQGSLRKGGDTVRITITLIDTITRGTLWVKTFDGNLNAADLFEFEDAVAGEVASTLVDNFGIIPRKLTRQALEKRTDSLEAYDAVLRWSHYFTALTDEAWDAAFDALEHAVQADPNYALTHAMLADMYGTRYHLGGGDVGLLEQMQSLLGRALELDPHCQLAHQLKAMVRFFRGQRDLFLDETKWAVQLNPNNSNIIASCGLFLAIAGEWEHGLALLDKAMRLNPHYPGWYHLGPFLNLYRQEAYGKALQEAVRINVPGLYLDPLGRASALGQLGRWEDAARPLAEMERLLPKTGIELPSLMQRTLFSDENVEMLVDGLHKAGYDDA
jgi:adenylate cyclase